MSDIKLEKYDFENPSKILIWVKNWLGDILFTTPAIHAIRVRFPKAHITVLSVPWCAEVLKGNPDIDEIILNHERGYHKGLLGRLRLLFEIKKGKYDVCFLFHRSRTRAFLSFASRIKHRIGYDTKKRGFFLTAKVPQPDNIHMVDYNLNLLKAVGINVPVSDYVLCPSEEEKDWASRFIQRNCADTKLKVILNPGGNWMKKRWNPDNFAVLASQIHEKYGAHIIITGADKDVALADDISKKSNAPVHVAAGKTTIKTLAALIQAVDLYIGCDSGPTHVAAAVKTPFIALFGPTDPVLTGPVGSGRMKIIIGNSGCNIPCYDLNCNNIRCMDSIKVEEVLAACDDLLKDKL